MTSLVSYSRAFLFLGFLICVFSRAALASCTSPTNAIEAENCLPGTPQNVWDVTGAGDPTIQGFATDISVNVGDTINFKINTDADAYSLDIYRMGYYGGNGARLVASISPSASLPQTQPACLSDAATGLVDCGNWAISASWRVPVNATSGIYFAHLVRTNTGGDSHVLFIVRNDASHSAILFQTADETWEAYNGYAGPSLYGPSDQFDLNQRANKVSYNRPFNTRGFSAESATWVFGAEYPMVRFLEANGYDVSYFTGVDAARYGGLILNHKIYMTTGHDEYWSSPHRANVEAARDAGVNMAFFSGNEVFWKTRWESSIDGSSTPYRTLVCYKETLGPNSTPPAVATVDPLDPPTWTGTWRSNNKDNSADGGRPENALTGTLFMVNGPGTDNPGTLSIKVPAADGRMRFWRNTSPANVTAGTTVTLPQGTLGYEWDVDGDNGARPAGTFDLSTATYKLTSDLLLDRGGTYGAGTATHHMTLYRASNGALVFGAGTVQWSWGLDSHHDDPFGANTAVNLDMKQATVNLFADMGVQPATLRSGLLLATASTDTTPPSSTITWPTNGALLTSGSTITITGNASDSGGGVVGGVEISVDGGKTWHPATGRESWTYNWNPASLGTFNVEARATDDSGNIEPSSAAVAAVIVNPQDCPCSDWSSSTAPTQVDSGDASSVELGVRFRADFDGYITGMRFYKASKNTGTHIGNLWTNSGTLLASAVFTSESSSGWQQVNFSTPVAIASNITYVASYFAPSGHYSASAKFFGSSGSDNPPIHFLEDGTDGANGIYSYGSSSSFPVSTYQATNYWVDVVYVPSSSMPGAAPALLVNPSYLNFSAYSGQPAPAAQNVNVYNEGSGTLNWTATSNASWLLITPLGTTPGTLSVSVDPTNLASGTYTGTVTVSSSDATNVPQTVSVTLTVANLLLSSDFFDGTMNGWAFSPLGFASNWSVANGALQYNGGGHTQVYAGDSGWTDYTLSVSVKLSSLNDYPGGIRGRLNPNTGAGYAVWLYPAEGLIKLFRNSAWSIDSGLTLLAQGSVMFDAVNSHKVQLSFQGTQIQVFYDSTKIITATDGTYASGSIGLDVSNQVISFSNIVVTSSTPNPGSLTASVNSIQFSATWNTSSPAGRGVQLTGSAGAVVWTASGNMPWLSVSPQYGITPASLQVSVASSTLNPGTYSGSVTLVALGATNVTSTISVTLSVTAPPPQVLLTPASLSFASVVGQTPSSQILSLTNIGFGGIAWTASSDSPWLQLSAASGSTPQNVNISVNAGALAGGTYSGNITVTSGSAINSPQIVPVSLRVLTPDMTESFGDLASGWIVSPMGFATGWTVSNGTFSYNGSGLSQSCAGNSAWSDYTFDTTIQLANLSNWPGGVRARVNPFTGAGYAVWLYPGSGKAILYSVPQWNIDGPAVTQLAQAPLTFDLNPHDLQLDFRGNTIGVSWDGAPLMSTNDSSYSAGFVCLDANNQPISYSDVQVNAVQSQVKLDPISPAPLTFNAGPGVTPAPQNIKITAGGASTSWAATSGVPWLALAASGNLTPNTLTITAEPFGLAPGTYNATITLSAPGASNSPLSIPVTFAVDSSALVVKESGLAFFGATGLNPQPQIIHVSNGGSGVLNWTSSATSSWLAISPASGLAPASITVSPNVLISGTGNFAGTVTVSSVNVANSPVTVPVSLQVGSLLFSDNFSSGAGDWTISPLGFASGWSVVNQAYTYNGEGHTQSYAGSSTWSNYTVAADIQLSSLNDYPGGLRGRVNTTTGASYGVWIYPAEGLLRLYRINEWNIDAGFTLLGQSSQLTMDTNPHNLRLAFQGTSISVYYDDAPAISASDSSISQGAIALDVSSQPVSFANVMVISLP